MRYFVIEPIAAPLLPTAQKGENPELIQTSNLNRYNGIDYDARSELISEKFKSLMSLYLPRYDFKPVIYLDTEKNEQLIFWKFRPPYYDGIQAAFRNDGVLSHLSFRNNYRPIVFTVKSPKGVRSIVTRMAVAESALRRYILGLKFTRVLEFEKE